MSVLLRSPRVGLAVGPDALDGVILGSPVRGERVEYSSAAGGTGLGEGLRRLAARLESTHGRSLEGAVAAVALLPPLADARLLSLPPLRPAELRAVVRRDAGRHFLGVDPPRVVGVEPAGGRGRKGGAGPVLAAAASASRLEVLRDAVAGVGWRLERVVPAGAAWSAAGARGSGGESLVVALEGATAHVLRMEGGLPASYRRVPVEAAGELAEAAGSGRGPAVIFGAPSRAEEVAGKVRAGGWIVPERRDARPTAAEAAARYARKAAPELVPPTLAAERADRVRKRTVQMGVAAVVLLVAAAAIHLWGTARELDSVRAGRAEIRDEVAPLVAARDSLDDLRVRMATIDEITGRSPRWTRALYELAMVLPGDAHLTSLVADDESMEIRAEAARAGAAIQALRDAESFLDVVLLGPVERELSEGTTVVERFRLEARLAPPGDPSGGPAGTIPSGAPASPADGGPAEGGGR